MDDGSVRISVAELEEARNKLEDDLGLVQMHRFPAGLRGLGDRYIVPVLVAIGPYHHGSGHLQKMEEVKRAAASHLLLKLWPAGQELLLGKIYKAVVDVAGSAGKLYADLKLDDYKSVSNFAAMMFFDACFLLYYMELRDLGGEDSDALSKLLFSNRACIDSDIMLLENQLPWRVVQAVIDSLHPDQAKHYKKVVVGRYIALRGRDFKILQEKEPRSLDWDKYENDGPAAPHLLGLLRRHKTEHGELNWPDDVQQVSVMSSAIELTEIGVNLTASETDLFTVMDVDSGPLFGKLPLAPLHLNDTRASCLVNMAAFEVASGTKRYVHVDPLRPAVCSYLALFSMFMVREEDVHELRAKHILCGHQTNAEMQAFFKSVVKHLPYTGPYLAYLMFRIEEYKQRRWMRTKFYKFMYNNFGTIIKMVTNVATLVGLYQGLLALNPSEKT